jgi:hypothetical protein
MKKFLAVGFALLALAASAYLPSGNVKAASAGNFSPAQIISDNVFNNVGSMSEADIQNFLNSKVPVCDTWHSSSHPQYQPPFTCLKDYQENGRSAARIIWEAAQNYQLNPQVILVTLQKEQGLITDTWPWQIQYNTAMGFACPDGGACDPNYRGFEIQVHEGARHFRNFYNQNPNWHIPFRTGNHFIQYNPNSGCGGTTVNIQNRATAALYSYTPYQPNQAALNNLYGSGDGCSAYGNRNFWRDFSDWFGSPTNGPYHWEFVSLSYGRGTHVIPAGERDVLTVVAKNTGTSPWYNGGGNPTRLGTWGPGDRQSPFATTGWVSSTRPATVSPSVVMPNETGTFQFPIQAPSTPGSYRERFNIVSDGVTWFNDLGLYFDFYVTNNTLSAAVASTDIPTTMTAGQSGDYHIRMTNNSNVTWYRDGTFPIAIGTSNPTDRASPFRHPNWYGATRLTKLAETSVAPGQVGTFYVSLKAPSFGDYTEHYSLVAEGMAWFNQVITRNITVTEDYAWQPVSLSHSQGTASMLVGGTQDITVVAKNRGTQTWTKNGTFPIKLATWPPGRSSPTQHASWPSATRVASLTEDTVAPGANGTFTFTVRAPYSGEFFERVNLVAEGHRYLNDPGLLYYLNAQPANYSWQPLWHSHSTGTANIPINTPFELTVKVRNTGNTTWTNSGSFPVRLATEAPKNRGSGLFHPNWITDTRPALLQEASVAPGAEGTFVFDARTPGSPRQMFERFTLIAEGNAWFNDPGFQIYVNAQ